MVKIVNEEAIIEMQEEINVFINDLNEIEDPRSKRGKSFSLAEIFFLLLCAQANSFESLREYEFYGRSKLSFLQKFLPYKHGYPSKSTLSRVLALFNPQILEEHLLKWMSKIMQKYEDQKHIAVDGKTHRGLRKKEGDSLHLVHAYGTEVGLVLGQEKVSEKSNEITAIPKLLNMLQIAKQVVTIDAMGCQKEIAKVIIDKEADYVLGLKGNQKQLHDDVELYFKDEKLRNSCVSVKNCDKGHGRFEERVCYVTDQIDWLESKNNWAGFKSIACIESYKIQGGKEMRETRYFISSLPADANAILHAVRAHWGVESMHWCLDVVFREDDRIIWNSNFARNEAILRRLALNLLKKYQDSFSFRVGKAKPALKTMRKLLIGSDENMVKLLQGICCL